MFRFKSGTFQFVLLFIYIQNKQKTHERKRTVLEIFPYHHYTGIRTYFIYKNVSFHRYYRNPVATVETSPLLIGDTIYFGASDGIIYGIDKESGQTTWKHKTGAPLFSTLSTNGNMIFATDFGGNVYAFKCNE